MNAVKLLKMYQTLSSRERMLRLQGYLQLSCLMLVSVTKGGKNRE